jgi:hypothetical protein
MFTPLSLNLSIALKFLCVLPNKKFIVVSTGPYAGFLKSDANFYFPDVFLLKLSSAGKEKSLGALSGQNLCFVMKKYTFL